MTLKQRLRMLRIKLGKCLLDSTTSQAHPLRYEKILFLRQDGKIGDYIVSSFVFREIKKQNPNAHIGVVCTQKNAFLFLHSPYIDQLHFVKKRNTLSFIQCGLALRKMQYDALIDPTVVLRNRDLLLLRLAKAKACIGYQKSDYRIFTQNVMQDNLHFSEIYRQSLQLLGFDKVDATYDIPFNTEVAEKVRSFLKQNSLTQFIAVNFFGHGSNRRFQPEKIRVLLNYLTANSPRPILLLTYPEVTEQLKQLAGDYPSVFVDGRTDNIFYSIEYIRHCNLLISPDTATVHIATGLSKPTIAFYSDDQENFAHWHPNNSAETHIIRYHKNINEVQPEQISKEWLQINLC